VSDIANLQCQLDQAMALLYRIAENERIHWPGVRTLTGELCAEAFHGIRHYKNVPVVSHRDPALPEGLLIPGVAYETAGPRYHYPECRRDEAARAACRKSYEEQPDGTPDWNEKGKRVLAASHNGKVVNVLIRIEPESRRAAMREGDDPGGRGRGR
jgi:hypothetical protein